MLNTLLQVGSSKSGPMVSMPLTVTNMAVGKVEKHYENACAIPSIIH